jgi:transglutaminase-like putative cysteine protease
VNELNSYLLPTELCDFDRDPSVREKVAELARDCKDERERFNRIYRFVKELPYGLEDWDVRASDTLKKGWGMCCGKTNLLVAMSRALLIPARYRVFRIKAEGRLLAWVIEQDTELAGLLGHLPREQDHLECEAYLDGGWHNYDPARDSALEDGLRKLGIPLEREPIVGDGGTARFVILASIDEWARKRQEGRRFREGREALFARLNRQFAKIRLLGSEA